MFDFHFSSLIKPLLLLVLVLGGCEYLSRIDKLKLQVVDLQTVAAQTKETAGLRMQELTQLKSAKDKFDEADKRKKSALLERDALNQKQRKLESEIKYLAASMVETVDKVRATAKGSVIAELKLPERESLHDARILKIDEGSISFLHQDGVANLRLKTEELPIELVKKFDMGPNGIGKRLQRLEADMKSP